MKIIRILVFFVLIIAIYLLLPMVIFPQYQGSLHNKKLLFEKEYSIRDYALNSNKDKLLFIDQEKHFYLYNLKNHTIIPIDYTVKSTDYDGYIVPTTTNEFYLIEQTSSTDYNIIVIDQNDILTRIKMAGNSQDTDSFTKIAEQYPQVRTDRYAKKIVRQVGGYDFIFYVYTLPSEKIVINNLNTASFGYIPPDITRYDSQDDPSIQYEVWPLSPLFPHLCMFSCPGTYKIRVNGTEYSAPHPFGINLPDRKNIMTFDGKVLWPSDGNIYILNENTN